MGVAVLSEDVYEHNTPQMDLRPKRWDCVETFNIIYNKVYEPEERAYFTGTEESLWWRLTACIILLYPVLQLGRLNIK